MKKKDPYKNKYKIKSTWLETYMHMYVNFTFVKQFVTYV